MPIPPEIERLLEVSRQREEKKARRREKIDEFWDRMRGVFGEKMPVFIPSAVTIEMNGQKPSRKPVIEWKGVGQELVNDAYWKRRMDEAIAQEKQDGCIQVKLGYHSYHLCTLDVDADELVEPVRDAMPFLKETFSTYGSKGRTYWFWMEGEYPDYKKQILCRGYSYERDEKGNLKVLKIEFLSDGHLCTIWGTHYKTAEPYRQFRDKVITLTFADIEAGVAEIEDAEWAVKNTDGADYNFGASILSRMPGWLRILNRKRNRG
jgi:hypothetical protein